MVVLVWNDDYFNYLLNSTVKFEDRFHIISGFVGGDSRFYYNMDDTIIATIYAGLISGGVKFGSIMSLVGIYIYVEISEFIFGNKLIGVFILNIMVATLILKYVNVRHPKEAVLLFCLFPLSLNYILVPNKELFGLLFLVLLASENKLLKKKSILIPLSLIRDSYAAQLAWFAGASVIGTRLMFVIVFSVIPLILPDNYFSETALTDGQSSGFITQHANDLLQIPLVSIFGFVLKIILGLFSGLIITPTEQLTVIKVQYFLCAIINVLFLGKIAISHKLRKHLKQDGAKFALGCTVYALFMCLAPGNPARFLGPLTFMFLYKLLTWKKNAA
ncbi:hypothetical protein OAD19_02830 [Octadecabacter sp.]|nr:hypothetical protein [Octadecabacter sp.]